MTTQRAHPRVNSFRDLIVWQRAKQLAGSSRRLCAKLPEEGKRILSDQILSAAASVMANIAEGRGRLSKADNVRHLTIARGSLHELESHFEAACEFEYVDVDSTSEARELAIEVGRMLNAQIRALGNRKLT